MLADRFTHPAHEFAADAALLVFPVYREIGQITAIAEIGQGTRHAHQLLAIPGCDEKIPMFEHAGHARKIGGRPPDAGCLEHCRKLLDGLDQAERMISDGRHKATGHLVVSTPAAFGRKHVAPHAPGFLAANPEVQLSFNLTDRVVDLVREGYDLGIRIGGSIDPNFVAIRLASNRRVVCGTPAYFEKHGVPKQLEDLGRHNCLAFNLQGGQQRGWYFQQDGKPLTVKVNGNLDCNDGELLHHWACEGLGLAWRSTWEIQNELASGALITVLDEFALDNYDIMAVYPQQRHVPAKIRFFVDMLKKVYAQPGYWTHGAGSR